MIKAQFLSELERRLDALPRAEIDRALQFYSEMIDDRKEEGLTEPEAVAALGSLDDIAGEVLAGASSYSSYPGGIEIEIDTRKDQRRQGLARACGARLMLECLERGLYPSWDAANKISVHLAETLGYRFREEYIVYQWEKEKEK